jgi:hypothetical protein
MDVETVKGKSWRLGVEVTMKVNRWSLGVGMTMEVY